MKVVLYMRYSSDQQTEQSIEGQRRVNTEFCDREGHVILKEYIDRAISGKHAESRPSFMEMIEDSEKGEFEGIVVYKLDRFARNRIDSAIYKKKLLENGVKVLSATEPIDDKPESKLLESVLEGLAEYYSEELSQKTRRGMRESAKKRIWMGGSPPYGYKIVDKRLVIDEEEAKVVRKIFELRKNHTQEEVLSILNLNKHPAWVQSVINNPVYKGVYHYYYEWDENGVPPIVDKATFDYYQLNRKRRVQRAAREYPLSGKLICPMCGGRMIGHSSTVDGVTRYYYQCSNSRKKICKPNMIRAEQIEQQVTDILAKSIKEANFDDICYQVWQRVNGQANDESEKIALKSERDELFRQKKNLALAIRSVKSPEELIEEYDKVETRINEINKLLEIPDVDVEVSLDEIREFMRENIFTQKSNLIKNSVESVAIKDGIEIVLSPSVKDFFAL